MILGSDHSTQAAPPTALANLPGRTRACVLGHLTQPTSTTELAQRLEVTSGTVSRHLGVLHRAGLVTRARHGHLVLYLRSPLGDQLLT
ncbi:ArsR/SmtB family transcription factor [Streptomyces sp. NEAU-W12]|uniref:ArsR/SmtB family transcription factor n=1 Tax=Streptomyces sp. NEAU-W12 TaxID=2994668 RepID=UPI00224AE763|nr:helix-turn-helix domain-containing protein [Streptomyces sp. NEAU-W12]MCX2924760.1 helix-turn-helix domain-containing protein [Streptomyces sp. NEAU-W12]